MKRTRDERACARCQGPTHNPKYCGVACAGAANVPANPPLRDSIVGEDTYRECRKCQRTLKRETEFRRQAERCGGFHTQCKSCDIAGRPASARTRSAASKKYYQRHRESVLATCKRWRLANSENVLARNKQRRARLAGVSLQNISAAMLNARAEVFGNACAYCDGPHEHWDHVIPIARGGKHCLANLRPACAPCNLKKSSMPHAEWLARHRR